ncbi:hypothetical protein [Tannerella sp.]|uniref:hypothetical protein n=1 Tax=Tannerella sp. TaxID=2382127 RepID=UPI0026DD0DCA|nr:hypothetical protein [Tannerella sp.]MDO4704568.1 hypothetical protein [Tannerella sp.]
MSIYHLQNISKSFWAFCVLIVMTGCEVRSSDLIEIDEYGNRVNNNGIDIETSLLGVGMKAYALDSIYTELMVEQQKTGKPKIVGFRKGMVADDRKHVSWDKENPSIKYGYDYTYSYKNYVYKILSLEDHGFVEDMEVWKDGNLYVQLKYHYDGGGYLSRVEVLNKRSVVYFRYNYLNAENRSNSVTIIEEPEGRYYTVRLSSRKIENKGYICNVLRYAGAPLTNEAIINPDLYYLGIYGTPVKYLPDVPIESGSYRDAKGDVHGVYSRVGHYQYFYEDQDKKH